jgi:hypothetical protein
MSGFVELSPYVNYISIKFKKKEKKRGSEAG